MCAFCTVSSQVQQATFDHYGTHFRLYSVALNIFILFNTDSAFEVLLNALAVEFVISLDEDLAQSDW